MAHEQRRSSPVQPVVGTTRPHPPAQPTSSRPAGAPAPIDEGTINAGVSEKYRREVARAEERLQRRLADGVLVQELAEIGFAGPKYESFENELASYGLGVMRGWLHSGYAFRLASSRGYPLKPSDRDLERLATHSDDRDQLATMTVARALPKFRDRALVGDGWRPEGGANMTTYFMGACGYSLPNEFRRWQGQQIRWHGQDGADARLYSLDRNDAHVSDAGTIAVGNLRVLDDLARLPTRTQAAVALTLDGWSQEEIAEIVGAETARAVEGLMYRWRKGEKQILEETQQNDQ